MKTESQKKNYCSCETEGFYLKMWRWIKVCMLSSALFIMIALSIWNSLLTLYNIGMETNRKGTQEKYLSIFLYEITVFTRRLNTGTSTLTEHRRVENWRKFNKKLKKKYKDNLKYINKRYPELKGLFENEWQVGL